MPKLTHREVTAMYGALQLLGNRFLPTINSDLRIGKLLQMVGPHAQPLAAGRVRASRDVIEHYGGAEGIERLSAVAQQAVATEISMAQIEFDRLEIEIEGFEDWPKLTQNDLPKERAGENGWQNGSQIAALVADLGVLFEYPKE